MRFVLNCKYFGKCGSCTIYNIKYKDELLDKKNRVLSLLSLFGVTDLEVFSDTNSHYRARAEFRIWHSGDRANYAMGNITKNGVISIDECPKVIKSIEKRMTPLIEQINLSPLLKNRLFSVEFLATTTDECLITLIYHKKLDDTWQTKARELEKEINSYIIGRSRKQKIVLSQEFITQKLKINNQIYLYKYYENGFTQPNPTINIKMIEWAIKQIKDIDKKDFLESYCGLGNFTIPLSKYFNKVLATEISKSSIKSAKENCLLNGIENIEFVRLSSEEMTQALNKTRKFRRLEGVDLNSYNFSTVLVDPPRAGLDNDTIELISNIQNIIYISCNPQTLTRDLKELTKTHTIKNSAIFDQFPHTHHIESGVLLQKKS
jgi:tRNA (uracil-5-)-methyltransferase